MPRIAPRASRRDHPLLRHDDGRRIAYAQFATALAHALASIALPFLALARTGSVVLAGLVGTAGAIAYMMSGLPAGLARRNGMRRRSLWIPYLLQALCLGLLLSAGLVAPVPGVLVLAASFGILCLQAYVDAGLQSAVGALTREEGMLAGQSAMGASDAAGRVAGLLVGGLAIAAWGPALALSVASLAFLAGVVLSLRLAEAPYLVPRAEDARARAALSRSRAVALRDPVIRGYLVVGVAWNAVTVAAAMALVVPFLRMEVHLDPQASGMVMAGGAAAGVLATQLTGSVERMTGTAQLTFILLCASAVGLIGIALLGGMVSLIGVFCVLSAAQASLMVLCLTESQRRAPQVLRPLLASLARVGWYAGFGVGSALYSLAAGLVGLRSTYLLAGLLSLALVAAIWPLLSRADRALGEQAEPPAEPAPAYGLSG